jgi:protein involved in polysaccharide export with SLBB domain
MSVRNFVKTSLALCLLLGAGNTIAQTQKSLIPTQTEGPTAHTDFRLGAGDAVEVNFFYSPELNQTVQIRPDGHVSLQLVGDVDLSTLTVAEATSHLETLYAKQLKTPSISLQVRTYASRKVYVGGEVYRPGVVPVPGKMSVLDAVMESGGIKHTGNDSSIVLVRRGDAGTPVVHKISLANHNGEPSQASLTMLQPYDVILVPESKIAHVDRWVDQYVRQLIPVTMTAGFTYLSGGSFVP